MAGEKCRDCTLFDLEAVKNRVGGIMRNWGGKCLWKSREAYPISLLHWETRPQPGHMQPDQGEGCPCFVKR